MISSVNQIKELPHKATVYGFRGTITDAFVRKEGTNEHGKWSFETFLMVDDQGDKIRVSIKDSDALGWPVGAQVELAAWNGEKGWSGLYAIDETYKGTPRRVLQATKTGEKKLLSQPAAQPDPRDDGYSGSAEPEAAPTVTPTEPDPPAPAPAPAQPPAHPKPTNRQEKAQQQKAANLKQVREIAYGCSQLYGICFDAAVNQLSEISDRHGITADVDRQFVLATHISMAVQSAMTNGGQYGAGAFNAANLPHEIAKKAPAITGHDLAAQTA